MTPENSETLTPSQLKVLAVFRKQPFSRFTFKDLKELLKTRSHSKLQVALSKFVSLELVTKEAVGNVATYTLNYASSPLLSYISLLDQLELRKNIKVYKLLQQTAGQLDRQTEFYILLVFGSHAKGQATAKSDVDIAVIVQNGLAKAAVKPQLGVVARKALVPVDFQVFSRNEFLDMLTIEEENVGKEIVRNNIIYSGTEAYFKVVRKVLNEAASQTIFGKG